MSAEPEMSGEGTADGEILSTGSGEGTEAESDGRMGEARDQELPRERERQRRVKFAKFYCLQYAWPEAVG